MKKITIKTITLLATLTLGVGMLSACGKKSSSSTDTTIAKSSSSKSESSSSSSTENAKKKAEKVTELAGNKYDWLESVMDEVQDSLYEINDYQRITSSTKNMLQQQKDRLAELNITVDDSIDGAISDETLSDVVFVSVVPDEYLRSSPTIHNGEEGTADITCTFTVTVQTGYTQLTNDRDTDIANAKQVAETLKSQATSWKKINYTLTVNDTADGGTLTLDSDKWW